MALVEGNGQTARITSAVPVAPAVLVKDQKGNPMAGVSVTFSVSGGGGSVTGPSVLTNSSGVATVGAWVLGPTAGPNTLTAIVNGGKDPAVEIAATARNPLWTFMVYMAADNTLATSGITDIDEMEAAGTNPEVQVVVQAEFNRTIFDRAGLTPASVHLPNYNTVRFSFGGLTALSAAVRGPNNIVADIGNRDMTDPAQLTDFIKTSKANFPAERYAVVLWNHGGGYQGLLADETSAPDRKMKLPQLRAALATVGTIDVMDFDMCLMGGYETLQAVNGFANVAVFSEASEPGDGDPYTSILQALYLNPSMDAASLATKVVEQYDAYWSSRSPSTTKSAYLLTGFLAFENAINAVGQTLTTNVATVAPSVALASYVSQKYELLLFTDVVDVMDSISVRVSDATLKAQLSAVKTAALNSNFRLISRFHRGTDPYTIKVDRSTGLTIVLPSGSGSDWFPPNGQDLSLAEYQLAMPGKPWAQFLTAYAARLSAPAVSYADLGPNRWESYLVWDSVAVSKGADLDIWVLEPTGDLYIPFLGTVTPNGVLSNDSDRDRTYYEGYLMNRFVRTGRYKFYASLVKDPSNYQPAYDIAYRRGFNAGFTSLYAPNFPRLTKQRSWLNDASPTFAKVEAGNYTDLAYAAFIDVASSSSASLSPSVSTVSQREGYSSATGAIGTGILRLSVAEAGHVQRPGKLYSTAPSAVHNLDNVEITQKQWQVIRAALPSRMNRRAAALTARSTLATLKAPAEIFHLSAPVHTKMK